MSSASAPHPDRQTLHLVFGGELESLDAVKFTDIGRLDLVGIFADYAHAHDAWRSAAQRTVDDAHMRYFIVPLHEYLDPAAPAHKG